MNLPTVNEINVYDSLDERSACKNFLGKTLDQAEELFRESPMTHLEDLMWMGPVAFRFYVEAAIGYLKSESARGDYDAVNGFIVTLEFRLQYEAPEFAPIAQKLAAVCSYLIENHEKFDADPEIFGDLCSRYRVLRDRLIKISTTQS